MVIRDRNHGRGGKARDQPWQLWRVQPMVQGGEMWGAQLSDKGEVYPIRVPVQHVKFGRHLSNGMKLRRIAWKRLQPRPAQPHSLRDDRNEAGACDGIAACKQRHLMAKRHQLFGKP